MATTTRGFMTNPGLAIGWNGHHLVLGFPDRSPVRLSGDEAGQLHSLLMRLQTPMVARDVRQLVDSTTIRALTASGALLEGPMSALTDQLAVREVPKPCQHLVVGVAGSIAAADAPAWVLDLTRHFADRVDVVFTESARHFVRPSVLEHWGVRTWTRSTERRDDIHVAHVQLAARAQLVLILFATANTMFRLAHGATSDLLSLIVSATTAPVVVVPGMNRAMWAHAPIQRNVEQLRHDGVFIIEPDFALAASEGPYQTSGHSAVTRHAIRAILTAVLGVAADPRAGRRPE